MLNEFHFVVHRTNFLSDEPANKLPTGPSLGIDITPDLATGPTDIFFDNGLLIGPTRKWPDTLHRKHIFLDGCSFVDARETQLEVRRRVFALPGESGLWTITLNGEFDYYSGQVLWAREMSMPIFCWARPMLTSRERWHLPTFAARALMYLARTSGTLRKNLVLTMGLRYEYNTPKYDTKGRTFSVIPGEQSQRFVNAPPGLVFPGDPGAPKGTNFPDKKNFAPRFGFAWDPTGSGKTSLRGGVWSFLRHPEGRGQSSIQRPAAVRGLRRTLLHFAGFPP